ncbi:MAG: YebC/PmpR family DNA-binding transcriptional regulator [Flavobacteriales bacterium]|nr:YebC/PmpR family DNA-binding transcriptional regulator [Flavobacteriales bacterium]
MFGGFFANSLHFLSLDFFLCFFFFSCFEEKGVITIIDEDEEIEEDKIMEDALEAGAEDIKCEEGEYTIYTETETLDAVRDAIISLGYKIDTADLAKVPSTYVELTSEEDIDNMEKMLDKFNEDDDVTAVFTNWDN